MAAMAACVIFVPVDATNFETTTGLDRAEFSSSTPEAADYLIREARLLAIGFLGLSLMSAAVAWRGFHQDDPSAGRALWLFPAPSWALASSSHRQRCRSWLDVSSCRSRRSRRTYPRRA
jgi:hypothetical protein